MTDTAKPPKSAPGDSAPDLVCYLKPGWAPAIRPAEATRDWMDATHEAFAYRCLPLSIANAHGWEVLSPTAFYALWTGGASVDDVQIRLPDGVDPRHGPISTFGAGVLTFHINGLFRTPPGWNLWVGGSPNRLKDAIQPLTAVIETDWSPYSFTMNWRFTRPKVWVYFERLEPISFFFPIQRGHLNGLQPAFRRMEESGELGRQFDDWSASRTAFNQGLAEAKPTVGAEKWQRTYFQGLDMTGAAGVADHQTKLRLRPFKAP